MITSKEMFDDIIERLEELENTIIQLQSNNRSLCRDEVHAHEKEEH